MNRLWQLLKTNSIFLRTQFNSLINWKLKRINIFVWFPDTAERNIIANAMNEYEKNTCITFVPRTEEVDYIVITAGGSGY